MQNNLSDQKTKPPKENPGTLWTQQTQSEMLCLFWETRNRPEIGHWESDYQNFGGENLERFIIHGGSRCWNWRKRYIYSCSNIHSPSKCLAWVKKCCHVWLDQNFEPSLLTNKLWLIFMGKKQKKYFFFEKKNSKWPTQKKCIFQNRQFSKFFCENFMDRSLG